MVTASLAAPIVGSFACAQEVVRADKIAQTRPMGLNVALPGFCAIKTKEDTDNHELFMRSYLIPNKKRMSVVVRRGSIYRSVHELYYCLIAREWSPEVVKQVEIPTKAGTMHAQLVRIHKDNQTHLSLMWYQWPLGSATQLDDYAWRMAVLTMTAQRTLPLYREVRVAMHCSEEAGDTKALAKLATDIYELPL